jgi:hypothetical protein
MISLKSDKFAHELSTLWDIVTLPNSKSGAYILNNNGKPVYQVGFSVGGVRATQSEIELGQIYNNLVSLICGMPAGTRIRTIQSVNRDFRHMFNEYEQRISGFNENVPGDDSRKFFVEQEKFHLQKLLKQRQIYNRDLNIFFTYSPRGRDAKDFVSSLALKAIDFGFTALGGASKYEQTTRKEFNRTLDLIDDYRGYCFSQLTNCGLSGVWNMSLSDMWELSYRRNHRNTSKRLGIIPFPHKWRTDKSEPTPRELLFTQEPSFGPDYVLLDGIYSGAVTLRYKPDKGIFPFTMGHLLKFPFEYEVITDISILPQDTAKAKLGFQQNIATSNTITNSKVENVEATNTLKDFLEVQDRVSQGDMLTEVSLTVIAYADDLESLKNHCKDIENTFQKMSSATALREQNDAWATYLATAPESYTPMARVSEHTASRAAILLPLNKPRKGHKDPFMNLPLPAGGGVFRFNPYDPSNTNYNGMFLGKSGVGKSAAIGSLLCGAHAYGADITILDRGVGDETGGTFKPFCILVGGSYVQLKSGSPALNPFDLSSQLILGKFNESDFGDINDPNTPFTDGQIYLSLRETAKKVLMSMVLEDRVQDKKLIAATISQALTGFYNDPSIRNRINLAYSKVRELGWAKGVETDEWKNYPVLKDFIPFIEVNKGISGDVGYYIKTILSHVFCTGLAGAIFNRPSNINLDSKCLVFDVKGVPDELMAPVVATAISAIIRRNYNSNTNYKMSMFDEAGEMVKIDIIGELMEEAWTTARKAGVSSWLASTDYEQLRNSKYWAAIKGSSSHVFLGQVEAGRPVDVIIEAMDLPREIGEQLCGPSFGRNRLGGYSTWLYVNGGQYDAVQNNPPKEIMWMLSNEVKEKALKKKYMDVIKDPYIALIVLAADYPGYAEGELQYHDWEDPADGQIKKTTYLDRFIAAHSQEYSKELALYAS